MKKIMALVLVFLLSVVSYASADEVATDSDLYAFDFKTFRWGDSKEAVIQKEGEPFIEEDLPERKTKYIAYQTSAVGMDVLLVYYFSDNALYRVRYALQEEHSFGSDKYIDDYQAFKNALIKKYGEPFWDNESWTDASKEEYYKGEKGMAIIYEYLTYTTYFKTDRTVITMMMYADNNKIYTHIDYTGIGLVPEPDYSGDI